MKNPQNIEQEIAELKALIADPSVPADEKDFAKELLSNLEKTKEKFGAKEPTKKDKPAKSPKPAKPKSERKFNGKATKDLTDEECDELRRQVAKRREKAAKAEKKSKSKPVIEKIASNVATGVKQAIENVPASDIKDDPKGEIEKMERVEKLAKKFLSDLRGILGEDYDREAIEGEFKEIHTLIQGLKKKYK